MALPQSADYTFTTLDYVAPSLALSGGGSTFITADAGVPSYGGPWSSYFFMATPVDGLGITVAGTVANCTTNCSAAGDCTVCWFTSLVQSQRYGVTAKAVDAQGTETPTSAASFFTTLVFMAPTITSVASPRATSVTVNSNAPSVGGPWALTT